MQKKMTAILVALVLLLIPFSSAYADTPISPEKEIESICFSHIDAYYDARLLGKLPSSHQKDLYSGMIHEYLQGKLAHMAEVAQASNTAVSSINKSYIVEETQSDGVDLLVKIRVSVKYRSNEEIDSAHGTIFQFRLSPSNNQYKVVDILTMDPLDINIRDLKPNSSLLTNKISNQMLATAQNTLQLARGASKSNLVDNIPGLSPIEPAASYNFGRTDMINWATNNAPKQYPTSSIPYVDFATQGVSNWDCTNFISHAMIQGGAVRSPASSGAANGWYFYSMNSRSYSWSAVNSLYTFLTRTSTVIGPKGQYLAYSYSNCSLGDIVQIRYAGDSGYTHSTMVTAKNTGGAVYVTSRSAYGMYNVSEDITTAYAGDTYRLIHLTTYTT